MRYKLLLLPALIFSLGLTSVSKTAFACPITDTMNMPHIFANVANLLGINTASNETNAKEEELRQVRTGNAGCSDGPTNKSTEIKSTAYDYLISAPVMNKIINIKICPSPKSGLDIPLLSSFKECTDADRKTFLTPQPSFEAAINEIKTKLFMEKLKPISTKNFLGNVDLPAGQVKASSLDAVKELRNRRAKYAEAVASTTKAIATQVRQKHKADMETLANAQAKGCNQTQSHAMQNRNMKALLKAQAASIMVQVMAMEQEVAIKFINEPIHIITEDELKNALGVKK